MLPKEIWKPVPKFESIYEISNYGNHRRIAKTCTSSKIGALKGSINSNGYKAIHLWRDGKALSKYAHRLVADCFGDPSWRIINHIDGNKSNNYIGNLEDSTYAENNLHAYRTGLKKGHGRKLDYEKATQIRQLKGFMSYTTLADKYGVAVGTIQQIVSMKTYKYPEAK